MVLALNMGENKG